MLIINLKGGFLLWKNCQPAFRSFLIWQHTSSLLFFSFQQILPRRLLSIKKHLPSPFGYSVKYVDENRSKSNNSMAGKHESHPTPDVWRVWIRDFLLPVFINACIGSRTIKYPITYDSRRYRHDNSVYPVKKICRRIPFCLTTAMFGYICFTAINLPFWNHGYTYFPCL